MIQSIKPLRLYPLSRDRRAENPCAAAGTWQYKDAPKEATENKCPQKEVLFVNRDPLLACLAVASPLKSLVREVACTFGGRSRGGVQDPIRGNYFFPASQASCSQI